MRLAFATALVAAAASSGACSHDPAGTTAADETTNTGTSGSTVGADSSTAAPTSSPSESTSEADSSSGGDSTGGDVPAGAEILILNASRKLLYYRYDDTEGATGPISIVEMSSAAWDWWGWSFGRQVVMRGVDPSGDRLVVGAVDDADHLHELASAPAGTLGLGPPTAIPGEDAVLFVDGPTRTLQRVDLVGDVPSAPVVVANYTTSLPPILYDALPVDALGRYTPVPVATADGQDLALARVDAPDPDHLVPVTAVGPMQSAYALGIGGDGSDLFVAIATDSQTTLAHVDLDADPLALAVPIGGTLAANESASYVQISPHRHGAVYMVKTDGDATGTLWWVGLDGGVAQAPVSLFDGAQSVLYQRWSDDGRWLALWLNAIDQGVQAYTNVVVDVDTPVAYEVEGGDLSAAFLSPDGGWVMSSRGGMLYGARIDDDGPGADEVILESDEALSIGTVYDFSHDGRRVLVEVELDDAPQMVVAALDGQLPATPVVVNRPPPAGDWAQFGEFSLDDRFVFYIERNDVFGAERVLVASLANPGVAVVAAENTLGFDLLRSAR